MTRRASKHGSVYTEGSSSARGDYPGVCAGCGEKIVMVRDGALWFQKLPGEEPKSYHWACRVESTRLIA